MKELVDDLYEKTKPFLEKNTSLILILMLTFQLVLLFFQHVLGFTSLIILSLLFVVAVTTYLFGKEFIKDKELKRATLLFKFIIGLFFVTVFTHAFISFLGNANMPFAAKASLLKMFQLITIIISVSLIFFFKKEEIANTFEELEENSIWKMLRGKEKIVLKPGDVQLCIDKETNEPINWYYKDRFLHMLILGPTGSGKTSQILSPLINQDLQNREAGLTVIEPKGDFAEQVQAMAEYHGREDETVYFNPIMPNCPSFNPLYGREEEVVENITTTFNSFSEGSSDFFKTQNETLVRNALRILKRNLGDKATFVDFYRLIHNSGGYADKLLNDFSRQLGEGVHNAQMIKENEDLISWFKDDYLSDNSKTYEHCSGLRAQVAKLISNPHLRRVLNPADGGSDVDFAKHLEEGNIMAISTAQGELRDLSRFLGFFIILQFQSSVFKRPGNEDSRKGHFLYIDEFQTYANSGFADMLTQGRSYRVASHLATQNRSLIGANSGSDAKNFIELVSTNARNIVIFPGGNAEDARFYSEQFGVHKVKQRQVGITRQKFNPLKGIKPMNYDSESIRETEEEEYLFTPTDIMKREFGEVIVSLVENNSVQPAKAGKVEYIPGDLYAYVQKRVKEFHAEIEAFKLKTEQEGFDFSDEEEVKEQPKRKSKPIVENQDDMFKYERSKKSKQSYSNQNHSKSSNSYENDSIMYDEPLGNDVVDDAMRHDIYDSNFLDDDLF